jgi:hypothetical protein
MTQELATQQQEVIEQKRTTWGTFGVGIYQTETRLQLQASQEIDKLSIIPTTIQEVPDAEVRLAEGKRAQKHIMELRKQVTDKLDVLKSRLMDNEKSLEAPITALGNEIIKLKKVDQALRLQEKAIEDELVRCKEFCQNEAIKIDSLLQNKVLDLVSRCYNKALESNVAVKDITTYIANAKVAITEAQFTWQMPTFHNAYITHDQVVNIAKANFNIDTKKFVIDFGKKVDEKFSDYDVAYANKADAIALSQKQESEAKARIEQIAQQQQVSIKIEAAAVTSTPTTFYTKALKKSYEVDMAETLENALTIIAAFSANMHLCLKHTTVKKWFGFGAEQAGKSLSKAKCEDNDFAPAGIIFKEVEKL